MKKLQIPNASTQSYIIQAELQKSDDSRYYHRLHGVLLVAKGFSCSVVACTFGHTVKTIENWVNRFNLGSYDALRDEKHTGRPSKLSDAQFEEIAKDIRINPLNLGYNQSLWDGKLLSYHIEKKFNITLSVRQCQRMFHKFDFRLIKPRPKSSKGDPKKQIEFKKN